jgi:3-hydroxyisobutyrate dehydrogenase-like beta-hydroxyacid dehydrogenase
LAGGHTVCGFDIQEAACREAAAAGVDVLETAAAVAERTPTLILSLMTSEDRRRLLWTEQRIAEHLQPGTLILDTTTAEPESIRADHAPLAEQRVRLVDVCVAGSSQTVAGQRALALVGDTAEGATPYRALLRTFTKQQYFFDRPGRGNEAKLVVNTIIGLQRLILAEGLALARAGGFNLDLMLDVLRQGDTYSVVMDTKGPKMAARTYEPPAARLEQHAKDVGLILAYAERLGIELPVSRLHRTLLEKAAENGAGALDNAAIFEAYS